MDPNYQPMPEDRPGGFHWGEREEVDQQDRWLLKTVHFQQECNVDGDAIVISLRSAEVRIVVVKMSTFLQSSRLYWEIQTCHKART